MTLPQWQIGDVSDGILRETTPEASRLVLWLPLAGAGNVRQWARVANVLGAAITVEQGVGATAATLIEAGQRVPSFLGKLLGRQGQVTDRPTWLLPHGDVAEQQGERQTDVVLVWAENESVPLEEAQVRARYPKGKRFQRLGQHLFLVAGIASRRSPWANGLRSKWTARGTTRRIARR
jgi:hypothetical protein